MDLPAELHVVVSENGRPIANLLVHYTCFLSGQYYCGGLIGLTDSAGRVSIPATKIQEEFETSQRSTVNLKAPLSECDPELGVGVLGGYDFVTHVDSIRQGSLVPQNIRALYYAADNARIASAEMKTPTGNGEAITARLNVEPYVEREPEPEIETD